VEQAIQFILARELSILQAIPPFDRIPAERLGKLLAEGRIVFFRRGSAIHHPEVAQSAPCFWVLRQGRVLATETGPAQSAGDEHLEAGALFPPEALLDRASGWHVYTAEEDCFLWLFEGESIGRWASEPCVLHWVALSLLAARQRMRDAAAELVRARQHSDQALAMPARSVGAADVAYVSANESVGAVARLMAQRSIGSVVVGTPQSVEGIVTYTDLVRRCIAAGIPYDTPAAQIMTRSPRNIDDTASVLEAGIEMAQSQLRHLLLRSAEGTVVGMVSERDIFRAQQHGIAHVFKPIDEAASVADLAQVALTVREFSERAFRHGTEISQFMRMVSSMNDRITRRLLEIVAKTRELAVPYCWLAFGSEAREEQGFVTDQDNGIVFAVPAGAATDDARGRLLAFAREVNDGLDACGFARCRGDIMAGNPEWCLSLDEWKAKFAAWIRATTPQALLNATIFFDLRPLHGECRLADVLLDHLLAHARGNTIFLHHMAVNALDVAPPIGRIIRFTTRGGTIDLKTEGSRLFVDVARIYALAHGVRSANTAERLRVVGQRMKRSLSAIEGDIAAFRFIQAARLRRQLDSLREGGDANQINPYGLDEMQQRILRESFRQAGSLQERLKLDYRP
jgi:CBS domain-containing protein